MLTQALMFLLGLTALIAGAEALVRGASRPAVSWGISPLVVGLTAVAFGTSAPEMAVSVGAALSGTADIAVGNVVGSNIFNLLAVLGAAGVVAAGGLGVSEAARNFDLWVMLAVAFACLPILLTGREIAGWEGALFIAYYAAYAAYLVLAAQRHDALPEYSSIMLSYVMPLTVITLVVSLMRGRRVVE
ncbi:MAG: sodium:calcium antiporter [Thiobacillus sp.]